MKEDQLAKLWKGNLSLLLSLSYYFKFLVLILNLFFNIFECGSDKYMKSGTQFKVLVISSGRVHEERRNKNKRKNNKNLNERLTISCSFTSNKIKRLAV